MNIRKLINESCGADLVLSENKIIQNRKKAREVICNLKVDRSPGWMTKERTTAGGQTVVPYKVIEQDIFKFYFSPGTNNYFEPGIARIAVGELEFDLSQKFSDKFMCLKKILKLILSCEDEYLKYDEDMNGLSFEELYNRYKHSIFMEYTRMMNNINRRVYERNPRYKVIKIESYEQSQRYAEYTCKNSPWCLTIQEYKFDAYTDNGKNALYFILSDDFREIDEPDVQEEPEMPDFITEDTLYQVHPDGLDRMYDKYGLSMIVVIVNPNGTLNTCASRWNHKFIEYSRDYLDEDDLSVLIGRNFYQTFRPNKKRPE